MQLLSNEISFSFVTWIGNNHLSGEKSKSGNAQYFVVWVGGLELGLLPIELQKDLNIQCVISNMA